MPHVGQGGAGGGRRGQGQVGGSHRGRGRACWLGLAGRHGWRGVEWSGLAWRRVELLGLENRLLVAGVGRGSERLSGGRSAGNHW